MKINKYLAKHYKWKEICDGWHLMDDISLSIIQENMPPNTKEDLHYHANSKQFFFILDGNAVMLLGNDEIHLSKGDGIEVQNNICHQMINNSAECVEFLVVSSPKSHRDKIVK